MLRDDRQIAFSETLVLCEDSAEHYRAAAEAVDDTTLAELFRALAAERDRLAEQLTEQVRLLGDLPRLPDPDRESLDDLITRLKSLFVADHRQVIIDERDALERQLADQLAEARALALDDSQRAVLSAIDCSVRQAHTRLAEARAQLAADQG